MCNQKYGLACDLVISVDDVLAPASRNHHQDDLECTGGLVLQKCKPLHNSYLASLLCFYCWPFLVRYVANTVLVVTNKPEDNCDLVKNRSRANFERGDLGTTDRPKKIGLLSPEILNLSRVSFSARFNNFWKLEPIKAKRISWESNGSLQ